MSSLNTDEGLNVKILPDDRVATSEDAANDEPSSGVIVFDPMEVLAPEARTSANDEQALKELSRITPTQQELEGLAKEYPVPSEWYAEG